MATEITCNHDAPFKVWRTLGAPSLSHKTAYQLHPVRTRLQSALIATDEMLRFSPNLWTGSAFSRIPQKGRCILRARTGKCKLTVLTQRYGINPSFMSFDRFYLLASPCVPGGSCRPATL